MTKALNIKDISVAYGGTQVLTNFNLQVKPGEFLAILGPSGCGKSTLLNLIAGFLKPKSGQILVGDKDVTDLPPQARRLSMVFQNYALFPHMSVYKNVAYGLEIKRMGKEAIHDRVISTLKTVGLAGKEYNYPRELSGGQQQRVSLARAMAVEPEILLLDEPLSNLDAKLRREMRSEIKQLQHRLRTTTILVTHDQDEALSLADRVAVMRNGSIRQLDDPLSLYNAPTSRFVAEFVGRTNTFGGKVGSGGQLHCENGIAIDIGNRFIPGSDAVVVIRPEAVRISSEQNTQGMVPATTKLRSFVGTSWEYEVTLDGGDTVIANIAAGTGFLPEEGRRVYLDWRPQDVILLPAEGHA
jgi:putative spermidine/putrescine transport system ATP-binding protein